MLVAPHAYAYPDVYRGLLDELERDHLVVTYDTRGTGASTRTAPTSPHEDVEDLEAVIRASGGDFVVVGFGDAMDRASTLAASRPELVPAVVSVGATVLRARELGDTEGLVASSSVMEALTELGRVNPRIGMREMLELTNPHMSVEDLRARLDATAAYCSDDAVRVRFGWLLEEQQLETKRALGERLWIAHWESNWSPPGVADRLRQLFPKARLECLPEGPISRPDLTADLVRRAVAWVSEAQI